MKRVEHTPERIKQIRDARNARSKKYYQDTDRRKRKYAEAKQKKMDDRLEELIKVNPRIMRRQSYKANELKKIFGRGIAQI